MPNYDDDDDDDDDDDNDDGDYDWRGVSHTCRCSVGTTHGTTHHPRPWGLPSIELPIAGS